MYAVQGHFLSQGHAVFHASVLPESSLNLRLPSPQAIILTNSSTETSLQLGVQKLILVQYNSF